MPVRFLWLLLYNHPERVIINTSLGTSLLFRDGILVLLAKLLNRKTLLIIHGFNEIVLRHKQLLKWGYFKADAICVLAEEFRKVIVEAGYNGRTHTQLNPVSEEILNSHNIPLPPLSRMIFIGRIETAKGIYISLDSFKLLKDKHPEMTFDVVGTGSECENVKKYIKDCKIDGVTMHGFKAGKEKNELLQNNAVTSFPSSHKEGLPISILEAMAVGQLIIARPIGGIVDLYQQCNFGKMISSLRAEDFAEAYEELIAEPDEVMRIRLHNKEFAKEHFSPQAIVKNIEKIFDEMQR